MYTTKGPMWGHSRFVLGAIGSFLEPFRGHLSPNIDNASEKLTLKYPHEGPWVGLVRRDATFDELGHRALSCRATPLCCWEVQWGRRLSLFSQSACCALSLSLSQLSRIRPAALFATIIGEASCPSDPLVLVA